MMEYKPGGGYNGDGFNHKRAKKLPSKLLLVLNGLFGLLFYVSLFILTAMIFGWWSILVDIALVSFFILLSRLALKRIEKKKLDKVI